MISNISQLVAQVESGNQSHAIRYEPNFTKYITHNSIRNCQRAHSPAYMSGPTAYQLLMFSYGKYQLMGENLYALGFKSSIAAFINSDVLQLEFFNQYVKSRNIDYTLDEILNNSEIRDLFSRKYNGSVLYGNRLLKTYEQLKGD